MSRLTAWLNRRAVRRATRIDDRWSAADQLWAQGRFAEYADELAAIAEAEAAELLAALAQWEGRDGVRQRTFRARMDAAYQGEELPYD